MFLVPADESYTVAIIKPDVVAHGKADEIIMKVRAVLLMQYTVSAQINSYKCMSECVSFDFVSRFRTQGL